MKSVIHCLPCCMKKLLIIPCLLLVACSSSEVDDDFEMESNKLVVKLSEVQVTKLKFASFEKEVLSIGRIEAKSLATLKFFIQENIEHVYVTNGMTVKTGQKIAALNNYSLMRNLERQKNNLDQSRIDYQDLLVGQGYKLEDTDIAPQDVKNIAGIKSGLNAAAINLKASEYALQQATLKSPIDGKVSNLFTKKNEYSKPGERFVK